MGKVQGIARLGDQHAGVHDPFRFHAELFTGAFVIDQDQWLKPCFRRQASISVDMQLVILLQCCCNGRTDGRNGETGTASTDR